MAGAGGAAVVSTPSVCRCSAHQFSSLSIFSASSSSFQRLTRQPQKPFPRLLQELSSNSSRSSRVWHSGVSFRFSNTGTNSRHALPAVPCALSSSHEKAGLGEEAVVEPVSTFLVRTLGALGLGSLVVGTARAALAETFEVPPASTSEGTPTDYLLSFLFFAAFIGLAVLTIGVVYLAVTDFLENRQRKAMQDAAGEEKGARGEKRVNGEKKDTVRIGSSKGFGVKKVIEKKSEKGK